MPTFAARSCCHPRQRSARLCQLSMQAEPSSNAFASTPLPVQQYHRIASVMGNCPISGFPKLPSQRITPIKEAHLLNFQGQKAIFKAAQPRSGTERVSGMLVFLWLSLSANLNRASPPLPATHRQLAQELRVKAEDGAPRSLRSGGNAQAAEMASGRRDGEWGAIFPRGQLGKLKHFGT